MTAGIVSAIVLIILIETLFLLLPEGKTIGLVKWSFSLIITIALITPIFSFFSKDFSNKNTYKSQINYLMNANEIALSYDKSALKNQLVDLGMKDFEIEVDYSFKNDKIKYNSVVVTINDSVEFDHDKVVEKAQSVFGEVQVYIYDKF